MRIGRLSGLANERQNLNDLAVIANDNFLLQDENNSDVDEFEFDDDTCTGDSTSSSNVEIE